MLHSVNHIRLTFRNTVRTNEVKKCSVVFPIQIWRRWWHICWWKCSINYMYDGWFLITFVILKSYNSKILRDTEKSAHIRIWSSPWNLYSSTAPSCYCRPNRKVTAEWKQSVYFKTLFQYYDSVNVCHIWRYNWHFVRKNQ